MKKSIVFSLGGSLIVPSEIDVEFLKDFRKFILEILPEFNKTFIITGGGYTVRNYVKAAKSICKVPDEDLDWLGIHGTRFNGHLLRTIFRKHAYPKLIKNPTIRFNTKSKLLIGTGWKPGCSTDYDAVMIANTYGADTVVNLSNIDYVFDKDPKKYKTAKKIKEISWKDFRKIVGNKWIPSGNFPFDPIASKLAQKNNIKVVVLNGKNLKNLKNYIQGKDFIGTVIKN